jgi:hypothetical protein
MTISSMEALRAVPVGGSIKVTNRRLPNRTFVRTDTGFVAEGVTLDPHWFSGHVAAGEVVDVRDGDVSAGDYRAGVNNGYIILRVTEDAVDYAQYRHRDGGFVDLIHRPRTDLRRLRWNSVPESERPAWYHTAYTTARHLLSQRDLRGGWDEALNEARQERDRAFAELAEVRRPRVAHVQVFVRGTTELPIERAARKVPAGATVTEARAKWSAQFTVVTQPVSGCQCGVVTRPLVQERLGLSDDTEYTFTVDCGRH